jgi:hypothetical protein
VSGNRKPEVIDKYVTSYDGVAFVYIFLDTLYFWVEDRACLKLLRKANKLYLCDLFWDTILLEAKKSRIISPVCAGLYPCSRDITRWLNENIGIAIVLAKELF